LSINLFDKLAKFYYYELVVAHSKQICFYVLIHVGTISFSAGTHHYNASERTRSQFCSVQNATKDKCKVAESR